MFSKYHGLLVFWMKVCLSIRRVKRSLSMLFICKSVLVVRGSIRKLPSLQEKNENMLVAHLAKAGKWLKPWQIGTHLRVLRESFPVNTNMTGLDGF